MSDPQRRLAITLFVLSLAAAVASSLVSCATQQPVAAPGLPAADRPITVRLGEPSDAPTLVVATDAGLLIDAGEQSYRYAAGSGGGAITLAAAAGLVRLPGVGAPAAQLTLRSLDGSPLAVAGKRYRGELLVSADAGGLQVLNRLPLDHYLYGVLPGEMPASWPAEALVSQAIAARSYALYEATHRAATATGLRFDVHDDVRSQVYGGFDAEVDGARRAVDETHGEVLLFAGSIVHTYFHSTCGGHTADVSQVLGDAFTAPLAGRPCSYCTSSKYYSWEETLDREDAASSLAALVRQSGGDPRSLGQLLAIAGGRADGAGRLVTLRLDYEGGSIEVAAPKARLALGPSKLRSLACRFETSGSQIVVRGQGWGHGVGLCQVGAKGLATAGQSGEQIATFYYPGAKVVRLQDRPQP